MNSKQFILIDTTKDGKFKVELYTVDIVGPHSLDKSTTLLTKEEVTAVLATLLSSTSKH